MISPLKPKKPLLILVYLSEDQWENGINQTNETTALTAHPQQGRALSLGLVNSARLAALKNIYTENGKNK